MLKGVSTNLKTLVLLKLTKRLIESTNEAGMLELERLVSSGDFEKIKVTVPKEKSPEEIQRERKKQIKKEVKEKLGYSASPRIKDSDTFIIAPIDRPKETTIPIPQQRPPMPRGAPQQTVQRAMPQRPPIPLHRAAMQHNLPETVQHIRPTVSEVPLDIDLGKLNPFLKDRNVQTIETEGEGQRVTVSGAMGKKPTGITMTKEEIDEVINKFSKESKIPTTEGLFKVAVGNILLTAMISETIGSRFILKKIV